MCVKILQKNLELLMICAKIVLISPYIFYVLVSFHKFPQLFTHSIVFQFKELFKIMEKELFPYAFNHYKLLLKVLFQKFLTKLTRFISDSHRNLLIFSLI